MSRPISLSLKAALLIGALVTSAPASALVLGLESNVTFSHSVVVPGTGTTTASDPDSASSGAVSSELMLSGAGTHDSSGPGIGQARLNAAGFSAVNADANFFSPGTNPGRNVLTSQTIFSQTETNMTGASQDYQMLVFLKQAQLRLANFCCSPSTSTNPFTDPASDAAGARINYTVTVNGTPIFIADAQLYGFNKSTNAHVLDKSASMDGLTPGGATVSSDLGGTFFDNNPGGFSSIIGYDFNDITDILDVGTFSPGETFTVVATMTAEVSAYPFEIGGLAFIADPTSLTNGSGTGLLTITGGGGGGGGGTTPVPEPGTLALFGLGLAGLGFARRRKAA